MAKRHNMIPHGQNNRKTIPEIAAAFGVSVREVKAEIERLRLAGEFVVTPRDKGGVYITDDPNEAKESIDRYQRQANTMEHTAALMRRAWDRKFARSGQLGLDVP